jgi:hypothetical protein
LRPIRLLTLAVVALVLVPAIAWSCHISFPDPPIVIVNGGGDGDGAYLSGTVTLCVNLDADVAIEKVEVIIDGSVATALTAAPYEYQWDTTRYTDGVHTLSAKSYGKGMEVESQPICVTVDNSKSDSG